jgi:hypothetical protein
MPPLGYLSTVIDAPVNPCSAVGHSSLKPNA